MCVCVCVCVCVSVCACVHARYSNASLVDPWYVNTLAYLQNALQTLRSITLLCTTHCPFIQLHWSPLQRGDSERALLLTSALLSLLVPSEEFSRHWIYTWRSNLLHRLYWFRLEYKYTYKRNCHLYSATITVQHNQISFKKRQNPFGFSKNMLHLLKFADINMWSKWKKIKQG